MRSADPTVRIGTSGWHYDHWRGPFYPEQIPAAGMLEFYAGHFDTVEINNSFYHLPSESAIENWRSTTPPGFLFAMKGSRYLTHMKKLTDPEQGLAKFMPRARILKAKLGPVLFHLPPRWKSNPERLEAFLDALPPRRRYAFEMRDDTWHNDTVYRLLRRRNAAFCIFDLGGYQPPMTLTADFTYVRMHGPGGAYSGDYPREALRSWAARIREWKSELRAIYVYFNNDQGGYAIKNALELRKLVD